jgi:hypothetical protein
MENQVSKQTPMYSTEIITLPSKGLLYSKDNPLSSGTVEMRYMTARHEDILTNESYIKSELVIDKLLEALLVSKINLNDILLGDKNAIIVAARILGYGKDYKFKYKHPLSEEAEEITVDLSLLEDKIMDENLIKEGKNSFTFTTSKGNAIEFKILTHGDDKQIDQEVKQIKKLYKNSSPESSTRLKHTILSVDGNSDKAFIRNFVDEVLLARDARELRAYILSVSPDINMKFTYEGNGFTEEGVSIPLGISFFWPDAST